mmetsp:Transcript_109448/g.210434  ORF Transcript_109448/g.210434 Transcript_109448/m.210434 type:complete len:1998 (-) Transcript_109448:75-6068(-)
MESRPSVRHAEYATGANGRKLSIRRASKAQGGSPRYSQSRRQSSHRRGSNMPRPSRSRSPMPEDGSPRVADRSPRDESPTPGTRPGSRLEKSVDESVKDAITDVQAQPWVRHDEHTDSDESDLAEEQRGEGEEKFAEQRQLYHHQKRASGLSVVSRTKVLRGVPTRLQVLFARQLKCVYFGPEDDEVLCRAGDSSPASNRFMVLDDGICDVLVPGPDGSEVVIGRVGPGSVIGGTLALGLTSTHLMTIRRSRVRSKDSKLEAAENDRDAQDEANTRPIELITHSIHGTDIEKLEEQFKEELDVLRRRVLLDLQRFVVPHIQRLSSNGFFRRYCSAFVKRVVRNMDMRICRPSELIFKENLLAQSMAILFCGKIDFFVAGKKVATQGEPGMCFGEAALLEDHAVRSASVRCNSEADCLICLLQKEDFLHALNEFPEEKNRLEEQVKTKLTRLSMQSVFADCERNFLHFLSATADAVELAPDQLAYPDRETPEALLICQRGELIVQEPSELDRRLRKGEAVGFEAALGLREGPPNYSLRAGESGCLLIRLTYSVLEQALIYFPGQLPAVLQVIGLTHLPEDHAFSKRQNEIWNIVNPLLCQAFMTLDIDQSLCRTLAPFFKPEICDPGCTITEEGKESDEMVLLVHGIVNWSTTDKVTTIAKAPRHFDEGLVMGTQRRHTATITAKSTCVLWLLSAEHVAEMKTRHWSVCKIFEEAAALRRSMQLHLQARLRNMKTFRRFRSEILEIISRNMDIRTYLPKEVIFAAGEEGDCMYILLQGKAEATVNGRIGQLEEGSTFGEMCLFGQVKRTMTVSSASLCICNVVHRDIITFAFTQFPDDKNANRDLGGPPATRGVSMSGGRAKASEEKLFSKKGKRESRSRDYHNKLNKEGNSRISLRTLDACVNRQNQVSTPEGGTPRSGVRRSTKGTTGPRSSKLVTSTSGSNSQLMSRSSIKAAERRSTRATFLKNQLIEDEAFSTSTESDSSEGSPRHHVVKLGRTSWIKSGSSARSSMNPQENQGANSQAQYSRRELDSAFADGELTRDAEVEDLIAGPQELQRRFQHRSCLFDVPTPKVPPADAELYYVAKDAEEKLSRAFRSYMPASSATTSARIHGVPGASRQRDKNGSFESSSFLNDASMSIGSGRPYHIGATYTAPLPPIQHTRPPGSGRVTGSRPKEGQRNIALAGNLQMLAASLLRINNKPTLTNVTLEELEKSAVEDKTLHSGMRELCENPSRATWSDSDSSDDLRGYWHQKKNQASKETSYISADSMRAITAPMLSRSEKHEHLKRSYLALPIMPSVPKKPGKQRPRPPHVRMYEEDYIYEEVPSTVGRHAFEDEEPQEPEKEVIDLESDQWAFIEKDRDKKDVQEEDAEQEQMPQDDELTDGTPTKAEVCFFIRSSVFRKLASRTSDVQRSQPLTLPIQSLSERHKNEHLDSMQCPSCGNTYMFDAKFCRKCGVERVQAEHAAGDDAGGKDDGGKGPRQRRRKSSLLKVGAHSIGAPLSPVIQLGQVLEAVAEGAEKSGSDKRKEGALLRHPTPRKTAPAAVMSVLTPQVVKRMAENDVPSGDASAGSPGGSHDVTPSLNSPCESPALSEAVPVSLTINGVEVAESHVTPKPRCASGEELEGKLGKENETESERGAEENEEDEEAKVEAERLRTALAIHPPNMTLKDLFNRDSGVGDVSLESLRRVAADWARDKDAEHRWKQQDGDDDSSEDDSNSDGDGSSSGDGDGEEDEDEDEDDDEPGLYDPILDQLNLDPGMVSEALKMLMMLNDGFKAHHCNCKPQGPHTCMSPAVSQLASQVQTALHSLDVSLSASLAGSVAVSRRSSVHHTRRSSAADGLKAARHRRSSGENKHFLDETGGWNEAKRTSKIKLQGSEDSLSPGDGASPTMSGDSKENSPSITPHASPAHKKNRRSLEGVKKSVEEQQPPPPPFSGEKEKNGGSPISSRLHESRGSAMLGTRGWRIGGSHVHFSGAEPCGNDACNTADAGAGPSSSK